jgi:hypothetical protein
LYFIATPIIMHGLKESTPPAGLRRIHGSFLWPSSYPALPVLSDSSVAVIGKPGNGDIQNPCQNKDNAPREQPAL